MRISDWSSDVCSSDLPGAANTVIDTLRPEHFRRVLMNLRNEAVRRQLRRGTQNIGEGINLISRHMFRRRDEVRRICGRNAHFVHFNGFLGQAGHRSLLVIRYYSLVPQKCDKRRMMARGRPSLRIKLNRSEEHTSELQSLMRISY